MLCSLGVEAIHDFKANKWIVAKIAILSKDCQLVQNRDYKLDSFFKLLNLSRNFWIENLAEIFWKVERIYNP